MYELQTHKHMRSGVNTKPIQSIENNWFRLRSVSLARNAPRIYVFAVNLPAPSVLVHIRHIVQLNAEKNSISTAYYFRLWIFFLSPRFYALRMKQIDWMNGTSVQTVHRAKMCVIVTHKYHVTQFFFMFRFALFPLLVKCIHFYFPVQCSIHTYFNVHTRICFATLCIPSGRLCEKDRHGLTS